MLTPAPDQHTSSSEVHASARDLPIEGANLPPRTQLHTDTNFDFVSNAPIITVDNGKVVRQEGLSRPGACRIRIFEQPDGIPIVMATDLDDANPGPSITNAAEEIATQVCAQYNLDPERLIFIEHYDDRSDDIAQNVEQFSFVTFQHEGKQLREPKWQRTSKSAVEHLIGRNLSP